MIYSLSKFEIALECSSEKFHKLLDRAYRNTDMKSSKKGTDVHIDPSLEEKGIDIEYHDSVYKKKIKFIVNPTVLLGGDDMKKLWKPNEDNISRLLHKLEKNVDDYFKSKYGLDDFKLTNIVFAVNIDVEDRKKVSAYIRVLQNIGKVKGFSPKNDDDAHIDSNNGFSLKGNSNGIEFAAYDKEAVTESRDARGILCVEVRLVKNKSIYKYTDETSTSGQLLSLISNCKNIFLETFVHIVPYGDYYKKKGAVKIIEENVPKRKTKNKMLKLLELIPEKKSLLLAQKSMNDRSIDEVMKMFEQINVSPVTLSKRHDVSYLDTLYVYLF